METYYILEDGQAVATCTTEVNLNVRESHLHAHGIKDGSYINADYARVSRAKKHYNENLPSCEYSEELECFYHVEY